MDAVVLALAALALCVAMTIAWAVRMTTGRSGWIDAIWSAAVGLVGGLVALATIGGGRRWLVAGLVLAWAARLAGHIAARTIGAGDDPRYAALARDWGSAFARRLFFFLQVQAAAGFVLVLGVHLAAGNPAPFPGPLDVAATVLLLIAVFGEAIADAQLARFRRTPRRNGAICEVGLWGWSRHPNYFFEWLGWCALALFAIAPGGGYAVGWLALAAPVLMYVLLVHVSGVPPLETHMLASRGEAYRDLQRRVSPFFPFPPRARAPESMPREDTP